MFMVLSYLMITLHSMAPHCHNECRNDVSSSCQADNMEDHPTVIHVLSEIFSKAAHPDNGDESNYHIAALPVKGVSFEVVFNTLPATLSTENRAAIDPSGHKFLYSTVEAGYTCNSFEEYINKGPPDHSA